MLYDNDGRTCRVAVKKMPKDKINRIASISAEVRSTVLEQPPSQDQYRINVEYNSYQDGWTLSCTKLTGNTLCLYILLDTVDILLFCPGVKVG